MKQLEQLAREGILEIEFKSGSYAVNYMKRVNGFPTGRVGVVADTLENAVKLLMIRLEME